jgi:long-chain acyl-CoA synthetase
MLQENIVRLISKSIQNHWEVKAFSNYQGDTHTYGEVGNEIIRWHQIFDKLDIKEGDKIALIGKNQINWAVIYLATISYKAVIVPVLPDFSADDLHHIIDHSDARLLFAEENILTSLKLESLSNLKAVFSFQATKKEISCDFINSRIPGDRADIMNLGKFDEITKQNYPEISVGNDFLAVINYTSGTTGFSKGVMLLHNSLSANIIFARKAMSLEPGEQIVSFLPLAHAFGCAFDFLYPFTMGCHITFLTRIPSPQIVIKAFKEYNPRLIFSVPLVIEKVYKNQILPKIKSNILSLLINIPLLNQLIYTNIRGKIYEVFGGNFREMVIGGAALNHEAEKFFKKMKLPFTIGYGMTECGPLISYAPWDQHKLESAGKIIDSLEIKIDSEDPYSVVGEILVRGENVMTGYYKNPEATRQVIDEDGWLHTGDLGIIDHRKNIYIKGRSKNMILGPSGQNIYPEEIESMINNLPYVNESLIVDRDHKLVALIFPEESSLHEEELDEEELETLIQKNISQLNQQLPGYMKISNFEIMVDEFEKTPKKSIKRFVYK